MPKQSLSIAFDVEPEALKLRITAAELGMRFESMWNPSPSLHHRTTAYELPRDLTVGMRENLDSASRFSPPPFAMVMQGDGINALVQVTADGDWHRWNQVEFKATSEHLDIFIDLEGQSSPAEAAKHIRAQIILDEQTLTPMQLLAHGIAQAYPMTDAQVQAAKQPIPQWWLHPSYSAWGDMASLTMQLEGPGMQCAAMAYCTQGLHERWIRHLEKHQVPVGTIIIDVGWSPAGWWKPDQVRWPDLRGFIDRQHQAGRRVVLWLATWLWEGLPDEWCLFADGRKLSSDPTHPAYREYVRQSVQELLSPDGYNADGFKIDQLSFSPDRRTPTGGSRFGWCDTFPATSKPMRLAEGDLWGAQLLHQLQNDIYQAAKQAKPDALITSSTVHPIFRNTFDMIRLHDMGEVATDIFAAMQARADLAQAALPGMPMDADDWIHSDYDLWRTYTADSSRIGVPCTFYAENFVLNWTGDQLTRPIDTKDLQFIAQNWRNYLASLPSETTAG